jgi:hypothetical protein
MTRTLAHPMAMRLLMSTLTLAVTAAIILVMVGGAFYL